MQNWRTADFQKVLGLNGYGFNRTKGDHMIYSKIGCKTIAITTQTVNACIAFRLIRDNNLLVPDKFRQKYTVG